MRPSRLLAPLALSLILLTACSTPYRPAVVVRDVIVSGPTLLAGTAPRSKQNTKGFIRGWDVKTGKRLWTFHTIPQPGELRQDWECCRRANASRRPRH